jgi:hypothetical protein
MKLLKNPNTKLCPGKRAITVGLFLLCFAAQAPAFAQKNGKDRSGRLTITSRPIGALVYMIGEYEFIGRTPFIIPYALYGRYNIKVNKRGYESINSFYRFTATRRGISIRLKPKKAGKAFFRSSLFPGWGQFYSERKFMGSVYVGATAAAFTVLAVNQHRYRVAQFAYQNALARTNRQGVSFEEQQLAIEALQDALLRLDSKKDARNTSLYVALGVWAINILDSVLFFPNYANDIEFFQKIGLRADPRQNSVSLALQFSMN